MGGIFLFIGILVALAGHFYTKAYAMTLEEMRDRCEELDEEMERELELNRTLKRTLAKLQGGL